MEIIDSHPHIYSENRVKFPTITDPWDPGEPASASDLRRRMLDSGVSKAVFIQTGTFYGFDNSYVIESSNIHKNWATGIITLNPDDEDHLEILEQSVNKSNISGLRGIKDATGRLSSPNVYRLWEKALHLGIVVNCMVMDDLERVTEIGKIATDLFPLRIVIDHCFMLNTSNKTAETLRALEYLAAHQNIYAKLTSGTHGSSRVYPHPDMHDPIREVITMFGTNRCVWGSNFPNSLWSKGTTYLQNLNLFTEELGLSVNEKEDILSRVPLSLWFGNQISD